MRIETLILKWTFGALFAGVTLIFIGKIAALALLAAKAKLLALQSYLTSGEVLGDAGAFLFEALQKAIMGGK